MQTSTAGSILLVEADREDAVRDVEFLRRRGYSVKYTGDGIRGLHLAASHDYDVIALDQTAPGVDGVATCRTLRGDIRKSSFVLLLMTKSTLEDRLACLQAGADGYLIRPFDIRELEARLRAWIHRNRASIASEQLIAGDLTLNVKSMRVVRGDRELSLSPIGARLLAVLMRESPRIVPRGELECEVWGQSLPDLDMLRSHLYSLRLAIDRSFDCALFHKVADGYCIADQFAWAVADTPLARPAAASPDVTVRSRTDVPSRIKHIDLG